MKKRTTTPCPYVQLAFVFPPPVVHYERVNFTDTFRHRFLAMHDYTCAYCGGRADSIDHFHPVAAGGTNDMANLYPACMTCNHTAHAKVFATFAEKQRYIIGRRIAIGTLSEPIIGDVKHYATCIDCGNPYRFSAPATIFLCPVCRYMDEHRPLPSWRRNRIDSFLAREFRGKRITESAETSL